MLRWPFQERADDPLFQKLVTANGLFIKHGAENNTTKKFRLNFDRYQAISKLPVSSFPNIPLNTDYMECGVNYLSKIDEKLEFLATIIQPEQFDFIGVYAFFERFQHSIEEQGRLLAQIFAGIKEGGHLVLRLPFENHAHVFDAGTGYTIASDQPLFWSITEMAKSALTNYVILKAYTVTEVELDVEYCHIEAVIQKRKTFAVNVLQKNDHYDDKVVVIRKVGGFGDCLMASTLVNIVLDNGYKAEACVKDVVAPLIDAPLYDGRITPEIRWYKAFGGFNLEAEITRLSHFYEKPLKITRNYCPVKYEEMPEIEGVDVAMVTRSHVRRVKNWPYFDLLKQELDRLGITWFDLTKLGLVPYGWDAPACNYNLDQIFLNYVKKSRVFLGLETGPVVYASQFAREKGLVLQSRYVVQPPRWNYFGYELILPKPFPCSPCGDMVRCKQNSDPETDVYSVCMKAITVEQVLQAILARLGCREAQKKEDARKNRRYYL